MGAETMRRLGRSENAADAAAVYEGAITTSVKTSAIACAASTSTSPWNATIPPKAETSSQANAAR